MGALTALAAAALASCRSSSLQVPDEARRAVSVALGGGCVLLLLLLLLWRRVLLRLSLLSGQHPLSSAAEAPSRSCTEWRSRWRERRGWVALSDHGHYDRCGRGNAHLCQAA